MNTEKYRFREEADIFLRKFETFFKKTYTFSEKSHL